MMMRLTETDLEFIVETVSCGWQKIRRGRKSSRPSKRTAYRFPLEQWSRRRDRSPTGCGQDRCEALVPRPAIGSSVDAAFRQLAAGSDDANRRRAATRSPFHGLVTPPAAGLDCRGRGIDAGVRG